MKITIKGEEINLKYSFRSMLIYENVASKSFNPTGLYDIVLFMYCCILASKKGFVLTFDEFLDWLDENPEHVNDFSEWLIQINTVGNKIKGTENTEEESEEGKNE